MSDYPFDIVRPPARRPLMAVLIWLVLALLIGGYSSWFLWNWSGSFRNGLQTFQFGPREWWGHLAFVLAAPFAFRLWKHARRMWRQDAFWVLRRDKRPPILFLRSFRDDGGDMWDRILQDNRFEEQLWRALRGIGPMIAIGRPGEPYPELGASRFYVPDHAWKDAVLHFLQRARAVVIFVGDSEGVVWEISHALKNYDRSRVLLCFPFLFPHEKTTWDRLGFSTMTEGARQRMMEERDKRYAFFLREVASATDIRFPENLGNAIFLDFSDPHTARPILSRGSPGRMTMTAEQEETYPDYARSLQPFIERLSGRHTGGANAKRLSENPKALKRARLLFWLVYLVLLLFPAGAYNGLKIVLIPIGIVGFVQFRRAIRRLQQLERFDAENQPKWAE